MPTTNEKISYLQNAVWKLKAARELVEDALGQNDPTARSFDALILAVNIELEDIHIGQLLNIG